MNNNFVIIKIENSCDKQPIEEKWILQKQQRFHKGEHY